MGIVMVGFSDVCHLYSIWSRQALYQLVARITIFPRMGVNSVLHDHASGVVKHPGERESSDHVCLFVGKSAKEGNSVCHGSEGELLQGVEDQHCFTLDLATSSGEIWTQPMLVLQLSVRANLQLSSDEQDLVDFVANLIWKAEESEGPIVRDIDIHGIMTFSVVLLVLWEIRTKDGRW